MKNRIWEIDATRGLLIALMVFYHMLFDLQYIFSYNINIDTPFFNYSVNFFAGAFIFVSGICANFSKSSLKRGFLLFGFSLIITLITYFYDKPTAIYFGILHFLAISMIITHLLKQGININPLNKLNLYFAIIISFSIILIGQYLKNINFSSNLFLFLGITKKDFTSLDYFPLFPWYGVFLLGFLFGKRVYKNKITLFPNYNKLIFLQLIGRNSLIIYLLHQPIILLVLSFLNKFL